MVHLIYIFIYLNNYDKNIGSLINNSKIKCTIIKYARDYFNYSITFNFEIILLQYKIHSFYFNNYFFYSTPINLPLL